MMDNILTLRQRKLLGILNSSNTYIKGRELAGILDVTDRTIRSDIQTLSAVLEPYHTTIEAVKGRGYRLRTGEPAKIQELTYNTVSILSPEDRMRAISMEMIRSDAPLDLGDLEDEMFVSQSTLQVDIQNIRSEYSLNRPYIKLIRRNNTITFEDNEWKKRYVMNLIMTWDWNYNYEAGMTAGNMPLPLPEMSLLDRSLHDIFRQEEIHLTEHDYIAYLCSIGIAVHRVRNGHDIMQRLTVPENGHVQTRQERNNSRTYDTQKGTTEGKQQAQHVSLGDDAAITNNGDGGTTCYDRKPRQLLVPGDGWQISPVSERITTRLGEIIREGMNVDLSREERHVLAFELDCRNQYMPAWENASETAGNRIDSREALQEIFPVVFRDLDGLYGWQMENHVEMIGELTQTLLSQLYNPYHSGVRNEQLRLWIRRSYPVCFDIAAAVYEQVQEETGQIARNVDVCEMAALLADGIIDHVHGRYVPRCAFISHYSMGGSHMLMAQLRMLFEGRLVVEGPFSVYEAEHIAGMHYDLIVLTTKVRKIEHNCPVIIWSESKFKENIELINFYLDLIQYRQCFPARPVYLHQLLHTSFFRVVSECANKAQAIHLITQDLMQEGAVDASFEKAVMQREKDITTANPAGFAIPYAIGTGTDAAASMTGMYVLHITRGMMWGRDKVYWVLLPFYRKEDRAMAAQIHGRINKVMNRAIQEGETEHINSINDFQEMLMTMEGVL